MDVAFLDRGLFKHAESLAEAWFKPGASHIATLTQIAASPDGKQAAAAAQICDKLEGTPTTRLAVVDIASGDIDVLTHGTHSDSLPVWSPDGCTIAFLSDRGETGLNHLRLFDMNGRVERATASVDGFVETIEWSSDGRFILLGVAGHGSDVAGTQGARAVGREDEVERPSWAPSVDGASEAMPWRSAWLYEVETDTVRQVSPAGVNIWQAVWAGSRSIAAICSDQPEETWWYSADVRVIGLDDGAVSVVYRPQDQLGWLTASPSGRQLAVIEAVCSDRNIVTGDLRLIDLNNGMVARPSVLGGDVVQSFWRDEQQLLYLSVDGPATSIGLLDCVTGESRELWRDAERAPSGPLRPEIIPFGYGAGDVLFMCESFFTAPTLVVLEGGQERRIRRFGSSDVDATVQALGSARDFQWEAADGLKMHGWLVVPPGTGPFPVIVQIHGGPIWTKWPRYLGAFAFEQMALKAGYALFQPNVRGSGGRGQDFARHVVGDMGGADAQDHLSGLDALERAGLIDPDRIGVMGCSYGGFMTSWLVTQDQRFAAAIPISPITDWVSEQYTCNIESFCRTFLKDPTSDPAGQYFSRSPVHFVDRVRTPALHICGALDKITPPGQALEFHRAMRSSGVESVLVTYPEEGHDVTNMPAIFDFSARAIGWFSKHMPT